MRRRPDPRLQLDARRDGSITTRSTAATYTATCTRFSSCRKQHGNWMLVLLHGYRGGPAPFLSQPFFDTLPTSGTRAPVVLLLDGGDHSYWHNRADGKWGSMVLQEAIRPGCAARMRSGSRSAGSRWAATARSSLGSRQRTSAPSARQSPALWLSPAPTRAGRVRRRGGLRAQRRLQRIRRTPQPLWIDVGTEDPFHNAAVHYAHEVHAQLHVWPGGHDGGYWHAHLRAVPCVLCPALRLTEDRAARPPRGDGAAGHAARDREAERLRAARRPRVALPLPRLRALHRGLDPHHERAPHRGRLPPGGHRLRRRGRRRTAPSTSRRSSARPSASRAASTGTRSSAATATAPRRRASCTASRCG